MHRRTFLASATLLSGCGRSTAPTAGGTAFVASGGARSLTVVRLAAFKGAFTVVRRIPLPAAPSAVLAHPRDPAVYVLLPETGQVQEIDPDQLAIRRTFDLGHPADAMQFGRDRDEPQDTLYVLSRSRRSLVRFGLKDGRREAIIALPEEPVALALANWFPLGAVTLRNGQVALLSLPEARVTRTVSVSAEVGDLRFRSDGRQVLVANRAERAVTVLTAPSGDLVTHLPLAVRPDHLCASLDGGKLFVTGQGMDAVVVVEPYQAQIAATLLAGRAPGAMTASTEYLFASNPDTGDVSIVDVQLLRLIALASVGARPGPITVTPDQQYALVLNQGSGDMAVLRIPAIRANRRKMAGIFTMVPVGEGPVSAAVWG